MIGIASRWITPAGEETAVNEHDIDRVHNEIRVDLDAFYLILTQAGYTRVDNLDPTQIRDA